MPLFDRARIEVYVPDQLKQEYETLLKDLDREFTHTFGGCTIIRGLDGSYLSRLGVKANDRINLIYTDAPFSFRENSDRIARYTDELRYAVAEALDEDAILVVALRVYHSV